MIDVMTAYYLGLTVFALNGLIWLGQRNERRAAVIRDERLRRIYMRKRR